LRWKLAAGFATLVAAGAIVWNVSGGTGQLDGKPQLAQVPPAAPISIAQGAAPPATADVRGMIRDPRLDELLAAHRQVGGTSALQKPAGFLRNATFEGPAR
jgi:sigma-E factor negative regulatory protein RseA